MLSLLAGRCSSSDVKPLQQNRREEGVRPDGTSDQEDAPRAKLIEHTILGYIWSRKYTGSLRKGLSLMESSTTLTGVLSCTYCLRDSDRRSKRD